MIVTKITLVVALVLLAFFTYVTIATGWTPGILLLVTAALLVVLIGGGNLLQGRGGPYGRGAPPAHRPGPPSGPDQDPGAAP